MAILAEKIEAIRSGADILKVIGQHVTLKKSGRRFVGLCPFHGEKTPSFSVSAEKNLYHCFGCHVGGDAFDFVMRHDGLDFQGAARALARLAGVELEPEAPHVRQQRELLERQAQANKVAMAFFAQSLWSPEGAQAQAYLKKRSIAAASARAWRLGFGGPLPRLLSFCEKKNVTRQDLTAAGTLSEDGQRLLCANRLIFPIHDPEGNVAGFGGRRLNDDVSQPKYVNSKDSLLFKKSALLFGLREGQRAIRQDKKVIIVEGYTDVLAAHDSHLPHAVAALGTAFSDTHAQLLKRFATQAVVLLDGDAAGLRAAQKVALHLLRAGLQTHVVGLPSGEDPDSFRQNHGTRALYERVQQAEPAVSFFIEAAFADKAMDIESRATAAQSLAPLLASLQNSLERDLYTHRLAEKVGVTAEALQKHLRQAAPTKPKHASTAPNAPRASAPQTQPVRAPTAPAAPPMSAAFATELELLRELLLFPELRARMGELADFALCTEMGDLFEALAESPEPSLEIVNKHVHDPKWRQRLANVIPSTHAADEGTGRADRTFEDCLASLKRRHIDNALREILSDLAATEARGEATDGILRRKQELTARKRALRRPQGASSRTI